MYPENTWIHSFYLRFFYLRVAAILSDEAGRLVNGTIKVITAKSQNLLRTIVENYIAEGQPVASARLAAAGVSMSPASIRFMMAELEEQGYLKSPHTSAGRIPTEQAYRFFVDSLIQVEPLGAEDLFRLSLSLDPDMTASELIQSASGLLSEVTQLAGLVTVPRPSQLKLKHIEFLLLSPGRVLAILVLNDHEVENRVIHIEHAYSEIELKEISNFLNAHYAGKSLVKIRAELVSSMKGDRVQMNQLMQRTLDVADQILDPEDNGDFVVAGQENLLDGDQTQRLQDLRGLFKAFSLKGDILHVLDRCMESDGIKLFIGQESGYELLGDCSLVTSPYQVSGECVGVLGVIGPTRMAYDRIIPIVDATARMLTAAMDISER